VTFPVFRQRPQFVDLCRSGRDSILLLLYFTNHCKFVLGNSSSQAGETACSPEIRNRKLTRGGAIYLRKTATRYL
jgi:hypothetical protein